MKSKQLRSYVFVIVQFACLIAIALTGPLIARNPLWLALEGAALLLGLWTVWTMRGGRFNIVPDVPANSQLVMHGPYRFIRHPMYATLLLGALALVLNAPTPLRVAVWVVLLIDLVLKLTYEERLLVGSFPSYAEYRRHSKRLVPFVY
jgi:protein-S-isoprenylcysteine O-methyltransferase Ste14